jgi:hypothetical protein
MPLRQDDNYRGPRALHVRSHRKLGKHRTLIRAALSLANWLVDHDQVKKVVFGKVVSTTLGQKFTPRVECKLTGSKMRLMLVAKDSAQVFEITTRSENVAVQVAGEIQRQWPLLQAAND